jgi:hypothetical protein
MEDAAELDHVLGKVSSPSFVVPHQDRCKFPSLTEGLRFRFWGFGLFSIPGSAYFFFLGAGVPKQRP